MEHCDTAFDRQSFTSRCDDCFCRSYIKPYDPSDSHYNFLLFQSDVHVLSSQLPDRYKLFQSEVRRLETNSHSSCWWPGSKSGLINRVLYFPVCSLPNSRYVERLEGKSFIQTKGWKRAQT